MENTDNNDPKPPRVYSEAQKRAFKNYYEKHKDLEEFKQRNRDKAKNNMKKIKNI